MSLLDFFQGYELKNSCFSDIFLIVSSYAFSHGYLLGLTTYKLSILHVRRETFESHLSLQCGFIDFFLKVKWKGNPTDSCFHSSFLYCPNFQTTIHTE